MEYDVGDQVFLKISPIWGVIRCGKIGKLNHRFIGPFKIVERVRDVVYRLRFSMTYKLVLSLFLEGVHDIF